MGTQYLFQLKSWAYSCEYGCFDEGYPSEIEAERAEAGHDCCFRGVPS